VTSSFRRLIASLLTSVSGIDVKVLLFAVSGGRSASSTTWNRMTLFVWS
jgi:hypothetical protein